MTPGSNVSDGPVGGLTLVDPADGSAAEALALLHRTAFERAWDVAALATLLRQAGVFAIAAPDGFILCRTVLDEAEILTLAVRPGARGQGLGRRLTEAAAELAARVGATRLFLEVAHDNTEARQLYARAGFVGEGLRRAYYPRTPGPAADALLLVLNLRDRLPTA